MTDDKKFAEKMLLRRSRKSGVCAWDEGACACTGGRCARVVFRGQHGELAVCADPDMEPGTVRMEMYKNLENEFYDPPEPPPEPEDTRTFAEKTRDRMQELFG